MDFEAESLNLHYARPFQVSYAIADNKAIRETKTSFIWWDDLAVSEEAARITRFDYGEYKSRARPAAEVLAEFEAVIHDPSTEVIWQNGLWYDCHIHQNWRRGCGKPYDDSYLVRSMDLKSLTQAMKKGWVPDISSPAAFLAWQYQAGEYRERGLKSSLENCAKEESIEYDPNALHDAEADIALMMKVFWKRLYQLEF